MVGSHVLDQHFSLTKVSLYLNRACLLSFPIYDNIPWECQGNFPFPQTPWAQAETTNVLIVIVIMLIVDC